MPLIITPVKTNKKPCGFTTLELIVSVAIFVAITALLLAAFRGGAGKGDLKLAREKIINDLRNLRSFGFAGKTIKICQDVSGAQPSLCPAGSCPVGQSCVSAVPLGGYGLFLSQCFSPLCGYVLFADLNGNLKYDGNQEKLENGSQNFANNILVYNFRSFNGLVWRTDSGPMTIIFYPYNGKIGITGNINSNFNSNGNGNSNGNVNLGNLNIGNGNLGGQVDVVWREQIFLREKNSNKTISFIINSEAGTIIVDD